MAARGCAARPARLAADEAPAAPPVEDLAAARARVEARLQRAVRLAVDGAITTEDLRRQRARLDAELGDLARREDLQRRAVAARRPESRATVAAAVAAALADLPATWAAGTIQERRQLLRLLAARVELTEARALRWTWWTAEELAAPE